MTDIKRYWVNGQHVRPIEPSAWDRYVEAMRALSGFSVSFSLAIEPFSQAWRDLCDAFGLWPKPKLSRKRRVLRFFSHQIFGHEGIACECGDGPVGLL